MDIRGQLFHLRADRRDTDDRRFSCEKRAAAGCGATHHMGIWRGIIAGLVGGAIAAGAMSVVHKGVEPSQE